MKSASKNIKKQSRVNKVDKNVVGDESSDSFNDTDSIKSKKPINNNETLDKIRDVEENIVSSNIHSPYIDTILVSPIMLQPNQMDNKMYLHLKTNLSNKLLNKCYQNYGYIKTIYKIEEVSDGIIEPEDPSCSAKMTIKFSCRLCLPIKNKEIICKIDRMNKALITAVNGPIKVIITPENINKDNFFPDRDRNIRIKKTSNHIVSETYIRVLILSISFSNYDNQILAIGFMQGLANPTEIQLFNDEY
jgi:DNA-directed RNA polymerase subunit E'/Rpb7